MQIYPHFNIKINFGAGHFHDSSLLACFPANTITVFANDVIISTR